MAEVKNDAEVQQQQHADAMDEKRKPDLPSVDEEAKDEKETPALEYSDAVDEYIDWEDESDDDKYVDYEETDSDDYYYGEDDDDDDEEGEEDEEADFEEDHSDGDPRDKGILVEGKGKGKLFEEPDVLSGGGGVESDGGRCSGSGSGSDPSGDPLIENLVLD